MLIVIALAQVAALSPFVPEVPRDAPDAPAVIGPRFRLADVDRDGRHEVYVVDPLGGDRLFRALEDGGVLDVTAASGLEGIRGSRLALFEDVDGDGWVDLYVCASDGRSRLLRNMADGTFGDLTGVARVEHGASAEIFAEFFDVDGDRKADLHVVTSDGDLIFRNLGGFAFEKLDLPLSDARVESIALPEPIDPATHGVAPTGRAPTGRATGAASSAFAPPSVGGTSSSASRAATTAASAVCAGTIVDVATSACIEATSSPTLGKLFPLALGVVPNLNADKLDGLDASAFSQLGASIEGAEITNGTITASDVDFAGPLTVGSLTSYGGIAVVTDPGPFGSAGIDVDLGHSTASAYLRLSSSSGGPDWRIHHAGETNTSLRFTAVSGPVDRLTLGYDGSDCGVNTSTPQSAWHVVGNGDALRLEGTDHAYVELFPDGPTTRKAQIGFTAASDNNLHVRNEISGAHLLLETTGAGAIGIGTSAPEAPVHVMEGSAGAVTASGNASAVFERSSTNYVQLLAPSANESGVMFGNPGNGAAGGVYYNANAPDGLSFRCNGNSTKMVIEADGDVGIGTAAPATDLQVVGSATLGALMVSPNEPSFNQSSELVLAENTTGTFGFVMHCDGNLNELQIHRVGAPATGGIVLTDTAGQLGLGRSPISNTLEVNGNASKSTAGSWLANSDRTIKTDVRSIDGALATLERLRPVSFRYDAEYLASHPEIDDVTYFNVIAQEFAQVFPEYVKPDGDGGVLQVDTYPMLIHAVAAVRELDGIVRAQQAALDSQARELAEVHAAVDRLARSVAARER